MSMKSIDVEKDRPAAIINEADEDVSVAAVEGDEMWDELYEAPRKMSNNLPEKDEVIEKLPGGNYRIKTENLKHNGPGLRMKRFFTKEDVSPYEEVEWEKRTATINNDKGEVIFEAKDLEFPAFWSQLATNVVVSKYFRGKLGEQTREKSLRDLIDRVVVNIAEWGFKQGCFAAEEDRDIFCDELTYLLLHQMGSFNSPVWFNVGQEEHPQCSACFINSVDDKMESIMDLAKTEGMLFKFGSGTGTNLSSLRASNERLSAGGVASGPVSFMKGYDAFAGVIKSGGKTRRAAKMVILNVEHPDILEFIDCKVKEEKKAWALIEMGYDGSFDGDAYSSVFFQNSNNSVRVTDQFMEKVRDDDFWYTRAVKTGEKMDSYRAREVMMHIAEATHVCGDPGLQFDTQVNDWNPCSDTMRINASNPCSEYMFVDDSACNLASLNLMTFRKEDGEFDTMSFQKAVDTFILAQEIVVDNASYPRSKITFNSHKYRSLGLGFSNLGALLMSRGLAYDSEDGRTYAAAITSLMTGRAYYTSARMAQHFGPFRSYDGNRRSFLRVINKHRQEAYKLDAEKLPEDLHRTASEVWDAAYQSGEKYGFRNAQVSVLAPTGTISFMMDCDTTGIEPDLALIKYKKLVGGGTLKMVNNSIPEALKKLGYPEQKIVDIIDYVERVETIEGAPHLKDIHLPVFDCALKPVNGDRSITPMGHIRMMSACQSFISGAISKTVNMPESATVEDIYDAYVKSWELGLKAVAVYRNNSKRVQPLNVGKDKKKVEEKAVEFQTRRRKLPGEREALTHKFSIGGHEGYLTVGKFQDGSPGEIFLLMSKEGSTISGLMDGFATMTSLALQYGVPLEDLVGKFSHMRFEPSGFTGNQEIPIAKSIYDYIFRYLASRFLSSDNQKAVGNQVPTITSKEAPFTGDMGDAEASETESKDKNQMKLAFETQEDAPPCPTCGTIMTRSASCYTCLNCGTQHGCG